MSIQNTISSWEDLLETARKNTSARRVKRPGQSPSTAPIPQIQNHQFSFIEILIPGVLSAKEFGLL
jgi:hypothetical protein